ncbi:hypothetical protein [Microscilla marina]|uniref:Uncharacterized protein n=1 Tax=Microscilla marina ATCC 23134 TaxID=313606 RepID=A1ZWW4_MICM2|nr:hypothetical protein [Microscilla marina]EAY25141.1 hypothetical protein M23134_05911 [Microscilla marina ATCC 23134]
MITATMETTEFKATMLALKHHFQSGQTTRYPLNTLVSFKSASTELPEEAKKYTKEYENTLKSFTNGEKTALDQNTNGYVKDKDFEKFKQRMNEQRNKAKQNANQAIDKYIDKMIDVGERHPEAQNAIVAASDSILSFFSGLINGLVNFVTTLISNIVQWLETAFGHVKNWVEGAINSIENFFSGILVRVAVA